MENINKSIIYGNIHQNRYGKFLPICSSINDRSKLFSIQIMSHQFSIIFMKAYILRNTTELYMLIEWKKFQLFSLLKRKISRPSIMKIAIVTKLLKGLGKNCSICLRNLVFLVLN